MTGTPPMSALEPVRNGVRHRLDESPATHRRSLFEHPGCDVSACHNPRVADQWEYGTLTIALTGIHEQAGVVLTTSRGHLTDDRSAEEGLSPITKLRSVGALGKDGWVIAEG